VSLAQLFESKFRGDIRFRGQAYLQAERVAIIRVSEDDVFGVVRDGVEYATQLSRQNNELRMFCSCVGDGQTRDPACKHLWATLLAVDAQHLVTGAPKPGHIPPFFVEVRPSLFDDPADDEDGEGDVYIPPIGRGSAPAATAVAAPARPAAPKMREWEQRLESLRSYMAVDPTRKTAETTDREIYYEVDLEESLKSNQLVIQTSQRQRRASGQWGKLKPLKIRPGRMDELELQEDRQILAYLMGGVPDRSGWFAQQAEFQTSIFRYRVPYELCELLLPMMCTTGRVRFLGDEEKHSSSLAWDTENPWTLALVLRHDDANARWGLGGELRRDAEVLKFEDTRLLVPGGLVVTEDKIARVEDFGAFDWVKLVRAENGFSVGNGEERELVDQLLDMPTLPELDLPTHLKLEEAKATPVAYLTLKSPRTKGWKHERLTGVVEFEYLDAFVSGSSARWAIVQREKGRCILRDRNAEAGGWSQLKEAGFRRMLDQRNAKHDVEIPVSDLANAVRRLIPQGWQVRADGKQIRQAATLQFRIRSGIDWFELTGDAAFEGAGVGFPELLAALKRGDNTVRLDDGSLGILPEEWLVQYGMLAGLGAAQEDHLRFSMTQVGLLDALLETEEFVEVDARFEEVREKLRSFKGVKQAVEPEGFKGSLRPYQQEGLGWLQFLQDFHFGGCLADDMGLGKTVQLLALLQERKNLDPNRRPSIVVVPKSLMFNWVHEIERFTQLKHVEYTGLERAHLRDDLTKFDIILTTYGTLRRDILPLKDLQFDYAVLDEAQTIKNSTSQVAKACRLLRAEHRIALSGTPIENHLGDLWSIFEFLNPGMLGRSSAFKVNSADAQDAESRRILARGLRPFVLRRTKREVAADLPEKFEETIYCQMGKRQRALYNELRQHYRESLLGMVREQGMNKSRMHVLEALLRLRQAACHPALLDRETTEEPFAKLDVLIPHLEELIEEGHKSLVFSQFTSMLSIVREHLDKKGVKYVYLDGKTRARKQMVDEFQDNEDVKVFLISLKAGGLGLNLTAAEYVFLLDPWWNPAVEAQAIDRAHRVGQTRQVFAYRLICSDTVEEKILELQGQKRELADAILEADGSLMQDLTADDLEKLLS